MEHTGKIILGVVAVAATTVYLKREAICKYAVKTFAKQLVATHVRNKAQQAAEQKIHQSDTM
jgi:hypothetical protein